MPRRPNPEIAIGFLVASIFWVGVLVWQPSHSLSEIDERQCEETARKSGHNSEECKTFWEKTTTDPVAFFTFWLVVSTIGLWAATGAGILLQTRDTRILQRAYLSVSPLGLEPYRAGLFISCNVSFENVGHLPARKVRWFIDRAFSDERYFNELDIKEERFAGKNVVTPGTRIIKSAQALDVETFQAAKLRTGDNQWFYIWGEVRYEDGFGKSRFTKFCHRYNFAGVGISGGDTVSERYARYHIYGNDAD